MTIALWQRLVQRSVRFGGDDEWRHVLKDFRRCGSGIDSLKERARRPITDQRTHNGRQGLDVRGLMWCGDLAGAIEHVLATHVVGGERVESLAAEGRLKMLEGQAWLRTSMSVLSIGPGSNIA